MNIRQFAKLFDHTNLKPESSAKDFDRLVDEAKEFDFYSVCVPSNRLAQVCRRLDSSGVLPITVIGFPLGYETTDTKCFQTKEAIANGAREVDFVIPVGKFLEGEDQYVLSEMKQLRKTAGEIPLKAIIETALLSPDKIKRATELCIEADLAFVKTSTGFSTRGASLEDIKLMRSVIQSKKSKLLIKASGGIKIMESVLALHGAGADRIGSSASADLCRSFLLQSSGSQKA